MPPAKLLGAFFACAIAFLAAAGIAAAAGADAWLVLHLAFVGGVSLLVLGAAQFFSGAFLATGQASQRFELALLGTWIGGTLALALGARAGGAVVLLAGLALFAAALRGMERRSLGRAAWAVRWYYAGAAFVAAGALLGAALAEGWAPAGGDPVAAHVLLNAGGWFGSAIIGTLHTFWPSLTGTRLARPELQGPAFRAWTAGIVLAAAGALAGYAAVAVTGWALMAAAAAALLVNVYASLRDRTQLSPWGVLVGVGQVFLLAGTLAGAVAVAGTSTGAPEGPERTAVAWLLLGGWIGCTVAGSLVHLLGVLARIRRHRRASR
jgi:nitrite reductase (NO-forming)